MVMRDDGQERGALACTVIVCTYNRADRLPFCLAALAAQDLDPDAFELIVVDNASKDTTRAVVEAWLPKFHHARYVYEATVGLSSARNRGMTEARGKIIAFTDDDCRPEPQWLAELLKQFAVSPIIGVVAGKVVPDWEETPPTWLDMNSAGLVLACLDYAASVCELPPDSVRGAGFAFRREVLPAGEAFRTDLGLKGGALLGSDEAEFCQRVFRQGFRVVYTPFAVVHHHIPKDRVSRSYFIQRWYGQGRSNYRVELMTASEPKRSLAAQVYDTLLSVVWFYREKRRSRLLRSKAVRSEEADIFSISCNQERQTGYMHENMHHQLYAALLRIRSRFPRAHGSVEATQE